jgi:hypothetical protein
MPGVCDLHKLGDKICEVLRSNMDSNTDTINASIAHNNKGSTFYERLIVADGAIIALSLTFLGTLVARTPTAHLPRHEFYSLVCTAWGLLLVSMFLGLHQVRHFHETNTMLIRRARTLSDEYHLYHLGLLQNDLARLTAPLSSGDLSKEMAANGLQVLETAKKVRAESDEIVKQTEKKSPKHRLVGRLAMLCTEAAILLLCVFTVKSLPLS